MEQPGAAPGRRIWCYYSPLAVSESNMESPLVLEATLGELTEIYDWPEVHGSPSNIWQRVRELADGAAECSPWSPTRAQASSCPETSRDLFALLERQTQLSSVPGLGSLATMVRDELA
jgi:hypothetical protein